MVHDFYRPLGLEEQRRARRPAWRLGARLPGLAAVLVVLGGSAASIVLQPDFMPPAAPEAPVEVASPKTLVAPAADPTPTGPNIIRMNEDGGVNIVKVAPFAVDEAYTGSIRVLEPGSLRQSERLAHIPDEALFESSAFGLLPKRAEDGRRPLDVYAGAHSGGQGARIALVVGGLGISQTGTQAALKALPDGVTLAFAAAGNSLDRWMQEARRNGHELLLQAPMEPLGYPNISPGPDTLTAAEAAAGDLSDLYRALSRLTNYVGVMNFMGARLTAEPDALEPVLTEIARRGLLFVDDGTSNRSRARDVALAGQIPFAGVDRVLDTNREPEAIRAELDVLERSARAQGSAIGFASAFDVSVETIATWIGEAEARGVEIVPISALAFDPEAR